MAYRAVLAISGVRALTAVGFFARVPVIASEIALTLHVVLTLQLGYGAAGLVGASSTIGTALGAPLLGRMVDRRGLRVMLAPTLVSECAFWTVAPLLHYHGLLVGAFVGGVLGVPVYAVVRQSVAALVPEHQRRVAFALDSMSMEVSFIIGPAVGTLLAVQVLGPLALWLVGLGRIAGGVALWVLNPPTRGTEEVPLSTGGVRAWLTVGLGGALLGTCAAVFVLFGTELVMIASLQTTGQTGAIPVVNAVWSLASLAGGYVYGLLHRGVPLAGLVAALAVATAPAAFGGPWWGFALLLIPAGMLCAPSLTASADTVSSLAPEHARGFVTGLHGSALTLGGALATPLVGWVVDAASPPAAVLVVAMTGTVVAAAAGMLMRIGAERGPAGRRPGQER